jgi:hypothetical protein
VGSEGLRSNTGSQLREEVVSCKLVRRKRGLVRQCGSLDALKIPRLTKLKTHPIRIGRGALAHRTVTPGHPTT